MRLVFGLVLLVGIALAGGAVYMAKGYIGQQQAQLAAAEQAKKAIVPTSEVFVVKKRLNYGQKLTPADVRAVRWPNAAIPEGAFVSMEQLFPEGESRPREVLRVIEKDEAILSAKVTEPGENAGVASRLSPGMRAFTIQTDVTSGVSGFLRPGDRVDVYWTGTLPGGPRVTRLIDANMQIIGINQSADEDRSSPVVARTVTVEITPRQVAALAQAQSSGRLSLSLVGVDDGTVSEFVEVDQNQLLDIEEKQVVVAPQEEKCYIRHRRGTETVQIEIPCTN
ncbi:Flp pilus assembly protein CpaB [Alphaproteobacteria bacterium GH1-50]|uniref:Flp pilus assembly protein CpaB n=1 Tax=Kangsaoukella pontilimi TaxID=2691042 RepID=A0A7C9J4D5_9RHOB|nr:Flp pilus assembly protein CpaB [Kangsaoukella pontilimi]MXQ08741.1 Flp pilus assembly protein CpaB [Kangsaoukella pontilimi]